MMKNLKHPCWMPVRAGAFFLGALLTLSLASCHSGSGSSAASDSANSPVNVLMGQIETLHEKTMGKIAPIRRMEDSLRARIPAVAAAGGDTAALAGAAQRLHSCDTTMFGWMGRYDMQLTGKTDPQKADYLQAQLTELSGIDRRIDSTLSQSAALLR